MSAWGPPPGDGRPGNLRPGPPRFASGESPNSEPRLVGRGAELAAIGRLLDQARSGESAALWMVGEPGIGKTALLDAARFLADDFLCLSCRGAETEADLPHAGLLELLTPVRRLIHEVPEGQAAAVSRALGWISGGRRADRFLVAAGTLSLLAAAADEQPVLVLVDDVHWLDRESAHALTFAARRLHNDAAAFLLNGRPAASTSELQRGIPVWEVEGLTDQQARELLPADVTAPVRARLTGVTGGNPLALLEVGRRLTAAQRAGASELPDPLPVGRMLHAVYDEVVAQVPDPLRAALLLVALDPVAAVEVAERALLDEGAQRGILVTDERRTLFRHPLLRSTVLRLATRSELRQAHLHLADHLPEGSPGRTRHLAAAATGSQDDLADALAELAESDRARSGHAAASVELERSAQLTSDPATASDRLVHASHESFLAGDLTRTRELVRRVLDAGATPQTRGRAYFTLGMLEQYAGSVVFAAEHLAEACTTLRGAELVDALTERALVAFRLNDFTVFGECASRIGDEGDLDDPAQCLRARFTGGLVLFLQGEYAAAHAELAQVTDLALSEELRDDPRGLMVMALAAAVTDTVDVALRRGLNRVDEIRERGGVGVLVPLLALTSAAHAIVGDHARAFAEAGEAADLAECLGYVADAALAVEQLAWQNAARGFQDEARDALHHARTLLERAGTVKEAAHHALNAAFCALCRDDLAEVASLLEARLAVDGGLGMMGEPLGVAPLLIEAYTGLGRAEDARALAGRLVEVTPASSPAGINALVLRSRGLTATDAADSRGHFEEALRIHADLTDPFERARTQLLFGSRLRRDGLRVEARHQLAAAHEAFASMELTRWAEVAASELHATGARARSRTGGTHDALTSQETRVALLVAEGRSNKEVAAALFLSPKTIERHLGNVFRKKGYRSRAELVRAYAGQGR